MDNLVSEINKIERKVSVAIIVAKLKVLSKLHNMLGTDCCSLCSAEL